MKMLEIPLPEPELTNADDSGSPWVLWLASLYEALRPLENIKLKNGGDVYVVVRSSNGTTEEEALGWLVDPEYQFVWNDGDQCANSDSIEDGRWILEISIDRTFKHERSEEEEPDTFNFYLGDFEGEGRVAKAKLTLALEIIMKRLAPPPTDFSSRLADILTLLR